MVSCTFENGNSGNLRHVVLDAVVLQDDKVLMSKRAKSLTEGGQWGLLGGYMERDETLDEAVRREVLEESGYQLTDVTLIRVNSSPKRKGEDRQNIQFLYIATAGEKTGEPDWESEKLEWFDLNHLPSPSTIAFDHEDALEFCKNYLKNPLPVPVVI